MFTIGICDDDRKSRDFIKDCVDDYFYGLYVQYCMVLCDNGEELLEKISQGDIHINLLFLDIELPGKNGLQIKECLSKNLDVEKIIFVTSHTEIMQQAFGQRVVGFLNKPLSKKVIYDWIDGEYKEYTIRFVIPFGDRSYNADDILFIRTNGNYLIAKLADGSESESVREGIANITDRFGNKFIRVHKSYIANYSHIKKIKFGKIYIDNDEELPLGRSYWEEVKNKYDEYVLKKVKRRMVW